MGLKSECDRCGLLACLGTPGGALPARWEHWSYGGPNITMNFDLCPKCHKLVNAFIREARESSDA